MEPALLAAQRPGGAGEVVTAAHSLMRPVSRFEAIALIAHAQGVDTHLLFRLYYVFA
jgi:hypothetical protein